MEQNIIKEFAIEERCFSTVSSLWQLICNASSESQPRVDQVENTLQRGGTHILIHCVAQIIKNLTDGSVLAVTKRLLRSKILIQEKRYMVR